MNNTQSQRQVLSQFFGGSWITQGIYVAAELGIADLLAKARSRPKSWQTRPTPAVEPCIACSVPYPASAYSLRIRRLSNLSVWKNPAFQV